MSYSYTSTFSKDIKNYISLKVALGYSESTYAVILGQFDRFCTENFPTEFRLTKEMVEKWSCIHSKKEHKNGLHRRMIALKGFAAYLQIIGKETYIVYDGFIENDTPFIPYIFTDNEIKQFFSAADHLPWHHSAKDRQIILPVIFRVLYCCGLRPQEVTQINYNDFDLKNGTIYITNSKIHKDRIVSMSSDLIGLCEKYNKLMTMKYPERKYFFGQSCDRQYSTNWLERQFWRCWKEADVSFPSEKHPRVYDWRHNFATRIMMKWIDENKDIAVMLPYLSQYMGHSKLEDTLYYIHLIPEYMSAKGLTEWEGIPEVPLYED